MKRVLSLVLTLTLLMACVPMIAFAEGGEDPKVQAAYTAYQQMVGAMDSRDMAALKTATEELGKYTEELSEEQQEALVSKDEDFYVNLFWAAMLVGMGDLQNIFVADKNVRTAYNFVSSYEVVFSEETEEDISTMMKEMLPDIDIVYAEALTYMPSQEIVSMSDKYANMQIVLMFGDIESLREFKAEFEAMAEAIEAMTDEDLNNLAMLLEEEDGATVKNTILKDWEQAKVVFSLADAYDAYIAEKNEETAGALVEMYDSIFGDNSSADEELKSTVRNFFIDIDDVYQEATGMLKEEIVTDGIESESEVQPEQEVEQEPEKEPEKKPESKPEKEPEKEPESKPEAEPEKEPESKPEAETEKKPETEVAPKTGDGNNIWLWIVAMIVSGSVVCGVALEERKRRMER